MIHFVVPAAQQGWILEYLDFWGRGLLGRMRVLSYEQLAAFARFERGTYVLSALDQLGPGMLRFLKALHRRLSEEGGFRFLNHPQATLGRLSLLSELHRAGYNEFRAIPTHGDLASLRYPVFLRAERRHDGTLSPLLDSPRQVESTVGRAVLRGHRARDLVVVDYVRRSPDEARLREIFAFAGVGYGRIDYGMKDGTVEPARPSLERLAGSALPLLGRLARRRAPLVR